MQPLTTPAEKTLTVLRPDTADTDRIRERSPGSGKEATPFEIVFDEVSTRKSESDKKDVAVLPDTEEATDADAASEGENGPLDDETAMPRTSDLDPDIAQPVATDSEDTGQLSFHEATSPASLVAPRDTPATGRREATAAMPKQANERLVETTARARATGPERAADRGPSPIPVPSFGPPVAAASDRTVVEAQTARMGLAAEIEHMRSVGMSEPSGAQTRRTRDAKDVARLPAPPGGAQATLHAGASSLIQGPGTDPTQVKARLSSMLVDSTRIDSVERGREPETLPGTETRSVTGSSLGASSLAALPRSDLAQTMAMQIAAAIQKGGSGMKPGIELRLSPEELGAVRLTFTQSDAGVTVNIQAERAETLELLRRNIDTLAREFLDIGYSSADFTFDRERDEAQETGRPVDPGVATADPGLVHHSPDSILSRILISDRLDIRL